MLVGHDVLESATLDGEEIVMDMTKHELEQLAPFREESYTAPAPPAGEAAKPDHTRPSVTKGMRVRDAGGETLGVVDEVRTDEVTGELRAIVVREGGLGGGRQTREIHADQVDVAADELRLIEEAPRTHTRM